MSSIRRHPLAVFLVVTFAFTWAIWIPMALAGQRVGAGSAWPTHLPGLAGPALGAVAAALICGGRSLAP